MCLSHVWYTIFGYFIPYGNWGFDRSDDYIFCTTNLYVQIHLDFKKWLVFKDFILKDTK